VVGGDKPIAPLRGVAGGVAMRACQAGYRVVFAIAAEWVARLAEPSTQGASTPTSPAWSATLARGRFMPTSGICRSCRRVVIDSVLRPPFWAAALAVSSACCQSRSRKSAESVGSPIPAWLWWRRSEACE
jgi:hypothetical protein